MRVYAAGGELVAESPSRDEAPLAGSPRSGTDTVLTDARNLAPVAIELECVRMYAETGSLAEVSRAMGIAIYELQKLQRTQWWQSELAALRREESARKNAALTRIHNLTLEALQDRLEHGDLVMRGNGFVRCKLTGRDLARISEAVFKQRQLLNGEPTAIDGGNKKLEQLADKLRALGKRDSKLAQQILDMEAVDVSARVVATTGQDATAMPSDQCRDTAQTVTGDA